MSKLVRLGTPRRLPLRNRDKDCEIQGVVNLINLGGGHRSLLYYEETSYPTFPTGVSVQTLYPTGDRLPEYGGGDSRRSETSVPLNWDLTLRHSGLPVTSTPSDFDPDRVTESGTGDSRPRKIPTSVLTGFKRSFT